MLNVLRASFLVIVISLIFPSSDANARVKLKESLCNEFWGKTLATFVADPVDSSGKAGEMVKTLRKTIEDSMSTRMNIDFNIVTARDNADIAVDIDIKNITLEKKSSGDDPSGGAGKAVLGLFGGGDGGRIEAVFTVTDLRVKKMLWQKNLMATVSARGDSDLSLEELLSDRLAEIFARECFAKKKLRSAFPTREGDPVGSY